jgi:hypothetical protein
MEHEEDVSVRVESILELGVYVDVGRHVQARKCEGGGVGRGVGGDAVYGE